MHPAFSVIFLTTLIGVGQGLILAMVTGQSYSAVKLLPTQDSASFYGLGGYIALVFLIGGLIASVFHLGRPERAWRAATMWRTSWLSREVIALPVTMFFVFVYATMHYFGVDANVFTSSTGVVMSASLIIGILATLATFALFLCTGMIYACLKFLQEWHSPLTVINYTLLGTASGFVLATAFSSVNAPNLTGFYGIWAIIITVSAGITRAASLIRNRRLKPKSTVQTAIGVRHSRIQQKSMGMMGGAVNTRDFNHHAAMWFFKSVKWVFIVLVFIVPVVIVWSNLSAPSVSALLAAFIIQYIGLIAERWFFFAQANHPQNLYYQTI